jgi:uncharacterized protein (TIGR02444 family)
MELWAWASAAYARPGVSQACLLLQDEFEQNVCFLLWASWARSQDAAVLARGAAIARDWEVVAAGPLRAVRRALKNPRPPVGDAARERLRNSVKATELEAEKVLLETLERLGAPAAEPATADALAAAVQAWGRPAPDDALAALWKALS